GENVLNVDHMAVWVESDADGIAADLVVMGGVAAFGHPGAGEALDATLLAVVDAEDRALGARGRVRAACLDLDEDQGASIAGDDVELAESGARIALDDLPAAPCKLGGDQVLCGAADPLPLHGHSDRP